MSLRNITVYKNRNEIQNIGWNAIIEKFRTWIQPDYTNVAWWCNGYGVGLAFDRSRVRFPAVPLPSSQPCASCSHTCASVTKGFNVVPANGRWYSAAGKVTVGLASHWPWVTDFSGLSTYGLKGYEREMSTSPTLQRGMVDFTFTFRLHYIWDTASLWSDPTPNTSDSPTCYVTQNQTLQIYYSLSSMWPD